MGCLVRVTGALLSAIVLAVAGPECLTEQCARDDAADSASLLQSRQQRRICEQLLTQVPTFVLNLNRRTDRMRSISQVLSTSLPSLRPCRISAPDGKAWSNETKLQAKLIQEGFWQQTLANLKETLGGRLTKGAVALIFGHALMWELLVNSSFPFGLLMEDDIDKIHPGLETFLCSLLHNNTMEEFDVVRLQYAGAGWQPDKALEVKPGQPLYNTGAYVLSRRGAETLLRKEFPIGAYCKGQIDTFDCPINTAIRGAISVPASATQPGSFADSDVQQTLKHSGLLEAGKFPDCPVLAPATMVVPELLQPAADSRLNFRPG